MFRDEEPLCNIFNFFFIQNPIHLLGTIQVLRIKINTTKFNKKYLDFAFFKFRTRGGSISPECYNEGYRVRVERLREVKGCRVIELDADRRGQVSHKLCKCAAD